MPHAIAHSDAPGVTPFPECCSPNLLCIAGFDLRPLLDELGVALDKLDAPLRVLLEVVELILQGERTQDRTIRTC